MCTHQTGLLFWVDDIIIAGSDDSKISAVKQTLKIDSEWTIEDHWHGFLGSILNVKPTDPTQ